MLTFRYEKIDRDLKATAEVFSSIAGFIGSFYDPTFPGSRADTVGPGIYAALDPYVSRGYGGRHPQLYVLPVRAGTRILVTNIPARESDAQRGYDIASRLGCTYNSSAGETQNRFRRVLGDVRTGTGCEAARSALIQAFRDLNIEAILYGFGESASDDRASRAYRPDALSLISARAIDPDGVALFSDTRRVTNDVRLAPLVYRLYSEFGRDFRQMNSTATGDVSPPPRQLGPVSARTRAYRRWKSAFIAYFGPDRLIEASSRPLADFYAKFRDLYVDPDTRRLLLLLKLVVPVAEGDQFDPSYFNGIGRRLAPVAGMDYNSDAFARWTRAHDIKFHGWAGQQAQALIEQSLAEKNEIQYAPDLYTNFGDAALRSVTADPLMIIKLMRTLGLGPRLTQLETQRFMTVEGAAPFLTAPWPVASLSRDDLMANQRLYQEFLAGCLTLYQAPDRNLAEIQRGDCGLRPSQPLTGSTQ